MNRSKVVFLHSINMTRYQGHEKNIHAGSFEFAKKHGYGFEMYNFVNIGGRHYGFVELGLRKGHVRSIRLENLGASRSDSSLHGVLAVWTAPCRDGKGREVVGWYRNATLYRHVMPLKGNVKQARFFTDPETEERLKIGYRIDADAEDCRLLHPDERVLRILPYGRGVKGVPGQTSIYYPFNHATDDAVQLRNSVLAFIEQSDARSPPSSPSKRPRWRGQDQIRKRKIEKAAVKHVCRHFGTGRNGLGYWIESREKDGVGYDLLMTKGDVTLCVEVKGRSGDEVVAEFTANESRVITEHQSGKFADGDYRVCIVTDALNEHSQRRLHHFSWWQEKRAWIEVDGSQTLHFRPSGATIAYVE